MINKFSLKKVFGLFVGLWLTTSLQSKDSLTVAIMDQYPFVITEEGERFGLCMYLLNNMESDLDLHFDYKTYNDVDSLVSAVREREVDLVGNPATPAAQFMDDVDYTHPFMVSNLAIGFKASESNILKRLFRMMFTFSFLAGISALAILILIFGTLTWFFERKRNKNHFSNDRKGVWEAFWWSAVTMTTVGYGDRTPKTVGGRIVAMMWMFTAVVVISTFTGSVASLLTVDELSLDIHSIEDLKKSKIAVVESYSAERFLTLSKVPYIKVNSADEALRMLIDGEIDALVHEEPVMRYEISKAKLDGDIVIAPAKYSSKFYGFAMPSNHPDFQRINKALIEETNSIQWRLELGKYGLMDN